MHSLLPLASAAFTPLAARPTAPPLYADKAPYRVILKGFVSCDVESEIKTVGVLTRTE